MKSRYVVGAVFALFVTATIAAACIPRNQEVREAVVEEWREIMEEYKTAENPLNQGNYTWTPGYQNSLPLCCLTFHGYKPWIGGRATPGIVSRWLRPEALPELQRLLGRIRELDQELNGSPGVLGTPGPRGYVERNLGQIANFLEGIIAALEGRVGGGSSEEKLPANPYHDVQKGK